MSDTDVLVQNAIGSKEPSTPGGSVTIYIDGSCKIKDPRKPCSSVAYFYEEDQYIFNEIETGGTNQIAELGALRGALKWVHENDVEQGVCVVTDSMYCINIFNNYERVITETPHKVFPNKELVTETLRHKAKAMSVCPELTIRHIKSHGKDPEISKKDFIGNARADERASELLSIFV